jgi:hypothetical protein
MDKASKPWDKKRPFQRINSPSFGGGPKADGDGHTRGCRRSSDFLPRSLLDEIRKRLMVLAPSWVRVRGATEADSEQELYGQLLRSFQTWTDAPPFQWHRWYDWNFHVLPEEPFAFLSGEGNHPVGRERKKSEGGREVPVRDEWNVVRPFTGEGSPMECEWDTGSFSRPQRPGGMFQPSSDPDHDWAWPMTGDYVWVRGRWIYDGGHEFLESGGKRTCRSELHPCKAVAGARWEAFKFREQDHYVPAIQFMFFTSRFGGYHDFASLKPLTGGDYEFIVDLPDAPSMAAPPAVAIGHTSDFPFNTIALRPPELLIDFNFKPFFKTARGAPPFASPDAPPEDLKPRVELLPASGSDPRLQRQVKITIPIEKIAATGAGFYGVIVSLGWRDDKKEQARQVKKCTFRFENLHKGKIDRDTFAEEWRLKACVNGRWRQWDLESVRNNKDFDLTKQHPGHIVFYLHEDDVIRISSHGAELDLVDDVYIDNSNEDRTIVINESEVVWESRPALPRVPPFDVGGAVGDIVTGRFPSEPADWNRHIDMQPPAIAGKTGGPIVASYPEQRVVVRRIFSLMWDTFNDQNEPLGLIDPGLGPDRELPHNPLKIKDLPLGQKKEFKLTAYFTWELDDLAELLERPHQTDADASNEDYIDYVLTYSIKVEDQ